MLWYGPTSESLDAEKAEKLIKILPILQS